MKRSLEESLDCFKYKGIYREHKKVKKNPVQNYGVFDSEYYSRWLSVLTHPSAIYLRDHCLNKETNSFGITVDSVDGSSFLAWCLKEKAKYPRDIFAIQNGSFFDFHGIDAIICVEFGGLRAIGGDKPSLKCGTPLLSLQRLLDSLIERGFTIRVYQEFGDDVRTKFKKRKLCQVMSRSNPVYFRTLQSVEDEDGLESLPLVYLFKSTALSVDIANHSYVRYVGLGKAAFKAFISTVRPGEVYSVKEWKQIVPESYFPQLLEANETVESVLSTLKSIYALCSDEEFIETFMNKNRIPLLKSSSDQLGIASSIDCIPDVVYSALGTVSYVERDFFTKWLLVRPSEQGRLAMERICNGIGNGSIEVKNHRPLNPRKIYGLLSTGGFCKDEFLLEKIYVSLSSMVISKDVYHVSKEYLGFTELDSYEEYYIPQIQNMLGLLQKNVTNREMEADISDSSILPIEFLLRNEFYMVKVMSMKNMLKARNDLNQILVAMDSACPVVYYSSENDVVINSKTKPNLVEGVKCALSSKRNTNRKNSWTTCSIQVALDTYLKSCETCYRDQIELISSISAQLTGEFGTTLRLFLQGQVVAKCVHSHLSEVIKKGWNRAIITKESQKVIRLEKTFPHWLSSQSSTLNDIELKSGKLVLLTAPNATGKTTLIRSVMICSILAHSGLYIPAKKAVLPNIKNFFLRLPGSDRASEGLSSFESEMIDLQYMLETVDESSIICLDELARSTSPKEGIALSRAVMNYLLEKQCFCIFSTHFLDMLKDDLPSELQYMTMSDEYRLIPGSSSSSRALEVCSKFGIPKSIIDQAQYFLNVNPKEQISGDIISPSKRIEEIATKITKSKATHVKYGTLIPPNVTCKPSVYIIRESEFLFYIGESKDVINRQRQHINKNKRDGDIMIFEVDNKSVALTCETLIQRQCIQENIRLSSTTDSLHFV